MRGGGAGSEWEIAKDEYVSYLPAVKTAQSCAGRQKDGEREKEKGESVREKERNDQEGDEGEDRVGRISVAAGC